MVVVVKIYLLLVIYKCTKEYFQQILYIGRKDSPRRTNLYQHVTQYINQLHMWHLQLNPLQVFKLEIHSESLKSLGRVFQI